MALMLKVSETRGRIDRNFKINNYNINKQNPNKTTTRTCIIYKTVNFKAPTYSLTLKLLK